MYVYFVSEIKSTLIFMCDPIVCRFFLRTITFQKCEVNCKSIDFTLFSFICRLHICNSNHCNHQQFHHVGISDGETSYLAVAFINFYDLLIYLLLFVVKKNIETFEVVELITLYILYINLYF